MHLNQKFQLSDVDVPGAGWPPSGWTPTEMPKATGRLLPGSALASLSVLFVASEVFPLIKTGGLADIVGSLPKALAAERIKVKVMLPAYPIVRERCGEMEEVGRLSLLGHDVTLLAAHAAELDLILVHCPALFDRRGGPYLDETGSNHGDNWLRFAVLSMAAAEVTADGAGDWRPDIVHLHDWQAGLTAAYLRARGIDTPTVTTIHNLAFQGQFPAGIFPFLGLPDHFFGIEGIEYYRDVSYLKAGLRYSDALTTVSPTYAREILTEDLGMGMAGVLQSRRGVLTGILNGIDQDIWDPRTDPTIPMNYDAQSLDRRVSNRQAVERQFGLSPGGGAIVSVISRLTWQKGIDMLAPVVPGIIDHGARLVVLGDGDPGIVYPLLDQVRQYPGKVAVQVGYSEEAAHLLHAGSDIVLQPSRFEPCGLTQLYALKYGAVPVVSRTGGLAETVIDANEAATAAGAATGFHFAPGSLEDLYNALDRAFDAYASPTVWRRLQTQAMRTNFGWDRSAEQYARLYRSLVRSDADSGRVDH